MPPEKNTAFLVIHGVGAHTPFQACDSFVQGFCDVYINTDEPQEKKTEVRAQHKIKQSQGRSGAGIPWVQNYLSLPAPEKKTTIDFYEYYWDIYMVHEVRFAEAFRLLVKASNGAREFYKRYSKEHPELLAKATDFGEFGRKRKFGTGEAEFRPAGYLKLLGPCFSFLAIILPYLPLILKVLDKWAGTQLPIFKQIFEAFSAFMKEPVPDFAGDLVRYLDLDARSKHFETRQRIINGALEELRELAKDGRYDRIIIVGHSLGSVIAYDVINRIIQEVNARELLMPGILKINGAEALNQVGQGTDTKLLTKDEALKIKGLITFGSPLDKIACFFREYVKENKRVQRQILANLHGFRTSSLMKYKAKDKPEGTLEFAIDDPMKFKLEGTLWLNFYHTQDLISGKLDLYNLKNQPFQHLESKDGNIPIRKHFRKFVAHACYWGEHQGDDKGTNEMYETIIKEFFS
jgi:hypothetical protein